MKSKFLRRIGDQSLVKIPKELVQKLGLQPGDMLEAKEKDGVISLNPSLTLSKSQSCCNSEKWMEEEKEVDESLQANKGIKASDKEELFKILDLNT